MDAGSTVLNLVILRAQRDLFYTRAKTAETRIHRWKQSIDADPLDTVCWEGRVLVLQVFEPVGHYFQVLVENIHASSLFHQQDNYLQIIDADLSLYELTCLHAIQDMVEEEALQVLP